MNRYQYLAAFLYLSVRMENFMRWRVPIQDVVVRRWMAIREPDARRDVVRAHPARQAALARDTVLSVNADGTIKEFSDDEAQRG